MKEASWPEDAPHRLEEHVLTVVCGNTHLHWAVHMGKADRFTPNRYAVLASRKLNSARTPPVHKDELQDDPTSVLGRHLPKQAQSIVFGSESAPHRKETAVEVSAQRRIPVLSIYVVSTNKEHETGMQFLFTDVPARVFKLTARHFFTKEEGAYEGIGVDRVSALYACKETYPRRHCLVFDAGTAWTYSALNDKGHIVGGGIAPGVGARFRSMSDYCGNLPVIEHDTYHNVLQKNLEAKKAFPIFAMDTQNAMMTSVFSEIANQTRYLVKHFLNRAKAEAADGTKGKPIVAIEGGDAPFLRKVLDPDFSGVVESEPGTSMPVEEFEIEERRHLVHYGIGHLLDNNIAPEPTNPDDVLRELLNGTRIAKRFPLMISIAGDDIFRGSIMGVQPGTTVEEDIFDVRYDDGDSEQLDLTDVYDAFKLYLEVGEAVSGEKLKVDQLNKSVARMDEHLPKLKEDAQQRATAREEEAREQKEMDAKRKQGQAAKRGRPPSKATAAKKTRSVKDVSLQNRKTMYINKRIAKSFEVENGKAEIYFGTIDSITNHKEPFFWHVLYDDDDEEEFDEDDIIQALKLYQIHRADDPNARDTAPVAATAALKKTAASTVTATTGTTGKNGSGDVEMAERESSVSQVTEAGAAAQAPSATATAAAATTTTTTPTDPPPASS
eukprot:scaffold3702_cov126-Cylindrotheca_fusiformis.AAC.2